MITHLNIIQASQCGLVLATSQQIQRPRVFRGEERQRYCQIYWIKHWSILSTLSNIPSQIKYMSRSCTQFRQRKTSGVSADVASIFLEEKQEATSTSTSVTSCHIPKLSNSQLILYWRINVGIRATLLMTPPDAGWCGTTKSFLLHWRVPAVANLHKDDNLSRRLGGGMQTGQRNHLLDVVWVIGSRFTLWAVCTWSLKTT